MKNSVLRNKNCFITGATGGLGKEIARSLVKYDCNLFLTSNEKPTKEFLDELKNVNKKNEIHFETADLTSEKEFKKVIKICRAKIGQIDILVNSAGIFPIKFIQKSTMKDFDICFDINVRLPYALIKEFSSQMIKKKWGRIINIVSSSAYFGVKESVVYCASKHALLGLSRATFNELKEHNIRTFSISPGSMKTTMGKMSAKKSNQNYETFINPKEVAELITNLISYNKEMVVDEVRLNRIKIE